MSIFFQSVDLGSRLAILGTIMIAVVALLPTVRTLVPSHNKLTFS